MKTPNFGDDLIEALKEVVAFKQGKKHGLKLVAIVHREVNATSVRKKTGLSRAEFAAAFGVSARTLQDWEQGRRKPEGPARVLLTVIDRKPEAVLEALGVRPAVRRKVAARRAKPPTRRKRKAV